MKILNNKIFLKPFLLLVVLWLGGFQNALSEGNLYLNSPFGIMVVFEESILETIPVTDKITWAGEKFRDLGAKWSRAAAEDIVWQQIEPVFGNGYDWSKPDKAFKLAYENGGENFNTVAVINPKRSRGGSPDILPNDEVYFSNFVEALVERYDGDSINDYDPVIKVKYWQLGNEPFPDHWEDSGGTVDGYVRFAELSQNAIKKSDPSAKIILGTFQFEFQEHIDKINEVIPKLKNKGIAFDYADTHFWNWENNYKIPLIEAKSIFDENGYSNIKYIVLEFGTTVTYRNTTEKDQAIYLIKGYAYNIANGFSLIEWNNLVEWKNFGGDTSSIYNYMGLIADGENSDPSPAGTPRLSYYTYKKMTQTLEGADWDNIEKIQESGEIYIYKFTKNNKPIWIAWNDNSVSQSVTISGITSPKVKITEAIPKYELGENVTNYYSAFNTETEIVNNNQISITLGDKPVFVELALSNPDTTPPAIPTGVSVQ